MKKMAVIMVNCSRGGVDDDGGGGGVLPYFIIKEMLALIKVIPTIRLMMCKAYMWHYF